MTEFTSRYEALGIPYPDVATVCQGQCEGTGWVPIQFAATDDVRLVALWYEACEKAHTWRRHVAALWKALRCMDRIWWSIAFDFSPCDGWHFVRCPDCGGTGKRAS